MTRTEAIKEFFKKAVLPVAIAGLLYCIFKSACIRNGELDLLWLWILCGLPLGIHRMCVWIVPGGGAALFALNFIIGGLIVLSRKLNDALSSRLFYAHFDSHRDISHFKSSCFCELFF